MINDLDLTHWKKYTDLITDSLWIFDKRRNDSSHQGDYHGNFIPQVPEQILRRYTKAEDIVCDLFLGSGTTLIECKRLGRHGVGVDISPAALAIASERVATAADPYFVKTRILQGDSGDKETADRLLELVRGMGQEKFDHVFLHPPYHNIVPFSDDPNCLGNMSSVDHFVDRFHRVAEVATKILKPDGFLTLVIGDLYEKGEVIPLSMLCTNVFLQGGMKIKAHYVKNVAGNVKGKGSRAPLWRFRALKFGMSIFAHENVFVFAHRSAKPKQASDVPGQIIMEGCAR